MKCANYGGIIENTDYVCPYCGEDLKGPMELSILVQSENPQNYQATNN